MQDRNIMDFREKLKFRKEEKLAEGKNTANQLRQKSDKNISKAVDFIIKKFDEMI